MLHPIPSHPIPIPITSRHSLSLPDPAVKRTDARKSKQESGPLNPVTQTNTDTGAHTTITTEPIHLQTPWSIHTEYVLHFPFHASNESIVGCTVPLHLRTVLSVLQATLPVFPFLLLHAPLSPLSTSRMTILSRCPLSVDIGRRVPDVFPVPARSSPVRSISVPISSRRLVSTERS